MKRNARSEGLELRLIRFGGRPKRLQHRNNGSVVDGAERLHDALHVDGLHLVERYESCAALETAPAASQ